jgi:hypothetical protein
MASTRVAGQFGGRGADLNGYLRRALRSGWTVTRQGNSHWRWFNPEGRLILTCGNTPSRVGVHRAVETLRKAGL